MDTSVARLQPEGVLRFQSVPPLLSAYNRFMGGVDRNDQLRMMYVCDRKSRHYRLRLFLSNSLTMLLTAPICCTNIAALLVIFVPRIRWALGWSWCAC